MIAAIAEAYRAAWRFMLVFPLLFAVPVLIEFIQHVIEIRGGMYVDLDGARAAESDSLRLGWGFVKTLALTLTLFWMARYMAGLARPRVGAFEPRAVRLFLPVLGLQATLTVASLWGGGVLRAAGSPESLLLPVGIALFLVSFVLGVLLDGWKVAAALGNPALGPVRSIRMIAPRLAWSLAFSVAMFLPMMIVHYALSGLAIGQAPAMVWLLMAADSLVVGYLACILAATSFIIARRAAERAGESLAPTTPPASLTPA